VGRGRRIDGKVGADTVWAIIDVANGRSNHVRSLESLLSQAG